jgi:hypothetical protein
MPPHFRARTRVLAPVVVAATALVSAAVTSPASAATRPATPSGLHAVASSAGTYLQWTRSSVTGYVIQQATTTSFSGARTYRVRWSAGTFTPYGLTRGHTYYFRIRAYRGSAYSGWSGAVSARPARSMQLVRVMTYNSLASSFDGKREGSGRIAGWGSRMPKQVGLLRSANADAIAVQEASTCLIHYKSKPCWRQIDSLRLHLGSAYGLANTDSGPKGRYAANYILYKKSVLSPVGNGGNWATGDNTAAAYQVLRARATGARLLFVSVHLIAPRGASADAKRGNETRSVLRQAQAYAARTKVSSIVYGGDFNTYLGEWRTNDVSGSVLLGAGVSDGITVAQSVYRAKYDSYNRYYRTAPHGGHSLDHVYASRGVAMTMWSEVLQLSRGKFVGAIPSDHNPVVSYVHIPY